jgi:hypothetical protein
MRAPSPGRSTSPAISGPNNDDHVGTSLTACLLPLALLCLRVWRGEAASFPGGTDWGPYHPWARPWLLLARNRTAEARQALRRCTAPQPGLLAEALWSLTARAAVTLGDRDRAREAHDALLSAAGEIAGAASGMLTVGPVSEYLTELQHSLPPR